MTSIPSISQYMTLAPKTIAYDQTLEEASEYMRKLHVRHLPVTKGGRPIGIVSDRDISLLLSFRDLGTLSMKVENALTPNPYFTTPNASLGKVAEHMANEKFGCVLVMEQNRLVGIFTTIDALKALADVFRFTNSIQP